MNKNESFLGEIGKQLPVDKTYDDLFRPAVREVGKGLQGAVKLALAPITALVWSYEHISAYLDVEIPKYFASRRIEQEKIQTPSPDIAVPAIEAMRYVNKEILRKMYVDILGASMNIDTADFVHPSFVDIVRQLTPDEAKILKVLPQKGLCEPLINIEIEKENVDGSFVLYSNCGVIGYEAECEFPEKISLYVDNMSRLSLVSIPESAYLADDWRYDKIINSDYFQNLKEKANETGNIFYKKKMVGLTDYGMNFREICLF